jgi:hypothetical protein
MAIVERELANRRAGVGDTKVCGQCMCWRCAGTD